MRRGSKPYSNAPGIEGTPKVNIDEHMEVQVFGKHADSWTSFPDHIDALYTNKDCEPTITEHDEMSLNVLKSLRDKMAEVPVSFWHRTMENSNQIVNQLEKSDKRLGELIDFGTELVTNIHVANERREVDRRLFENAQQKAMSEKFRREGIDVMAKLQNIKERWTELGEINEPMELWEQMEVQKKRIADILKSKDNMIEECHQEIHRMDAKYEHDRQRQAADLCCLVERVDHQVEVLKHAFNQQLDILRDTVEDESEVFGITCEQKWRKFFDNMNTAIHSQTEKIRTRELFYSLHTTTCSEEQEEMTKLIRVRLDKEVERLELELRKARDVTLMNSEKLDYNYQVLQRRNDENIIILNQMKRRLSKNYETACNLRRSYKEIKNSGKRALKKLAKEVEELHGSLGKLEWHSYLTRIGNRTKYTKVWNMYYNELMVHINTIYEVDRILHEQQLLVKWERPAHNTKNINEATSKRSGTFDRIDLRSGIRKGKKTTPPPTPDLKHLQAKDRRLLRNIFRRLSDRAEFLMEDAVAELLEQHTEKNQVLVRVDSMFSSLRVRHVLDLQELAKAFEPYTYCPNCHPSGFGFRRMAEIYMPGTQDKRYRKLTVEEEAERKAQLHTTTAFKYEKKVCENHIQYIDKKLVVHALSDYSKAFNAREYGEKFVMDPSANYIRMEDDEIREFWHKFNACYPESMRFMWRTIAHGLSHFVEVLKQRKQYKEDVLALRRQNAELRYLLTKFTV